MRTTTRWLAAVFAAIAAAVPLASTAPVTSAAGEPPTIAWEPCPAESRSHVSVYRIPTDR